MDAWGTRGRMETCIHRVKKILKMRPETTHMTKPNLFISQNRGGTCAHDGDRDFAILSFRPNQIAS